MHCTYLWSVDVVHARRLGALSKPNAYNAIGVWLIPQTPSLQGNTYTHEVILSLKTERIHGTSLTEEFKLLNHAYPNAMKLVLAVSTRYLNAKWTKRPVACQMWLVVEKSSAFAIRIAGTFFWRIVCPVHRK